MAEVILKNVNKIYPNGAHAVYDFNLEIKDGEFIVLVGPSGCGKSTTLRMIAGLEGITSGDLYIDGERMNLLAPVDRDIAMVFQNYALYYNMSVFDNMGISLKLRHEQKNVIHKTVKDMANRFDLTDYLNRLPENLSGGQKQRVALGRAVVRDPKVFLMDEPLSNLDAKLREKTRSEIVKLQKELKTTTIYVTHDQVEAMTMADRIVVMNEGYIQQIATPFDLYNEPVNMFVAGFIGMPNINFINGNIVGHDFVFEDMKVALDPSFYDRLASYDGKEVVLGIRPEYIEYGKVAYETFPDAILNLPLVHKEFLGDEYYVELKLPSQEIMARISSEFKLTDKKLKVVFNMKNAHFFDKETKMRIVEDKK